MGIFSRYVEHLAQMGMEPGAVPYVKARARELEADQSGLFLGVYEAVNAKVKAAQESERLTLEKPL